MEIKLITNYNEKNFSSTELYAIDCINNNPIDFLKLFSLKDFCSDKPFSETTLQRLSQKLGYNSTLEMKSFLIEKYINKINNINNINKISKQKNEEKLNLNNFTYNLMISFQSIDWNIVEKLEQKILSSKWIYVYQPDNIFNFNSFDLFSNLMGFRIYRIDSLYRLKLLEKIEISDESILMITKPFEKLSSFEKNIINLFKNKEIEIFTFSGIYGLFPDLKNNIIIGNFNKSFDESIRIM